MFGRQKPVHRMNPSHQSFGSHHATGGDVEHRLIGQEKPMFVRFARQIRRRDAADAGFTRPVALAEPNARAALFLGLIHRGVGNREQFVARGRVVRIDRDPEAGGERKAVLVDRKRRRQHAADALRDRLELRARLDVRHDDGKLVASEPPDELLAPQRAAQAPRNFRQHGVAAAMADRVVDRLEAVDVEEEYGRADAEPFGFGDGRIQPFQERDAIGKFGERVGVGQRFDSGLAFAALDRARQRLDDGVDVVPIGRVETGRARLGRCEGQDPLLVVDAEGRREKGPARDRAVGVMRVGSRIENGEGAGAAQRFARRRTQERDLGPGLELRQFDCELDGEFATVETTQDRRGHSDAAQGLAQDRGHLFGAGEAAPHDQVPQRLEAFHTPVRVGSSFYLAAAHGDEHGVAGIERPGLEELDAHDGIETSGGARDARRKFARREIGEFGQKCFG